MAKANRNYKLGKEQLTRRDFLVGVTGAGIGLAAPVGAAPALRTQSSGLEGIKQSLLRPTEQVGQAAALSSGEGPFADIPFEHVIIDSHAPVNDWAFSVGDVNGDGQVDVVASGSTVGSGGLYWYEYPTWAKHVIDTTGGFSDDMQLVDVDGDGDLDIVVPEDGSKEVRWYENPRPRGNPATDPWKMHVIGSYAKLGFEEAHDVEVADLNGDGKVDVVIANQKWLPPRPVNQPETVAFFQNSPDSWTPVVLSKTYGEGTCIADLNGDGRPDIVKGGWWLENPKDPVHDKWPQHWFYKGWPDRAGVTVADINQDGRPDVVLSAAESRGRMSWFEAPPDPVRGKWIEHVINEHVDYAHTFKVADINLDGMPDIVFAEMQQSKEKRVGFFLNQGKGKSWKLQVVARTGSHNIRVADVDRDGDIDIIGQNWNTKTDPNHAPVEMWRNLLMDQRKAHHRSLDKWTIIEVDDNRGKWGDFDKPNWLKYFGLAVGDVTNHKNGYKDIVTGRYLYRNPEGNMTAPWKRVTFPINVDGMLLTDVDGDGRLDVIGEALPDVYWLKSMDDEGNTWKPIKIGTLPHGTDWNGQGYMLANLVPGSSKPQIILSTAHGIYYFMIPEHPENGNWPRVEIAPQGYDEGIGVGDVNGDGLLDISARYGDGKSLAWWQNPGDGSGNWVMHPVGHTDIEMDRDVMADIDGDGRPDIVVTEENSWRGDSVYWFQQPSNPESSNWIRHKLVKQFTTNSLAVADMNNDGDLDIITAEHRGTKKLAIWENVNHASSWIEHIVSTGIENHLGAYVADLDGDGDLDIVGIAWDDYQRVYVWRNDAVLRLGGALRVATPVISPPGGKGKGTWLVHITSETPGATIRYTLDGSEPTTSSAHYVEPLPIAGSATLRARAFKKGMNDSAVTSATFKTTYYY